jgi:hypothetical protein
VQIEQLEPSAHPFIRIPKGFISEYRQCQQLNCGQMNIECPDCGALHWIAERISNSSKSSPQFSRCCKEGGVKLPDIKPPPEELKDLYISQEPLAVDFWHNIRSYNCALAFTFVSYTDDTRICDGLRPFQIQGQLCH